MRILHVIPTYVPAWRYGGPIHSVHGLCKALAARGHEVHVATTNVDGPGVSEVPLGRTVEVDAVRVHYFAAGTPRRLYFSPAMGSFLRAFTKEVDLVHTHSVFLWPTTAAARVCRALAKPYVVSPRGMLVRELIARRSSLAKRFWIALFERRNLAQAAGVHVTSARERQDLAELGIAARRVFEIPNGLDAARNEGDVLAHADPERPYLLFLGRISWKKGLDRLLRAMALLPDVQLRVAGNDDEDYWPRMAALAAGLGISDRIVRMGYVEGGPKDQLVSKALALVLPSYSENFGNVVLEAMQRGVPVVVTPEVGLASTVADSRSGLVSSGEPSELAAAIGALAADAELRSRLGANGRRAAQALSWGAIAERMESEYAKIVDGQP